MPPSKPSKKILVQSDSFAPPPPETPDVVTEKGYTYKRLLKFGGFANIFLAFSTKHGQEVAVKQFLDFDKLGQHYVAKCLWQELKIACAVKHPNLMTAFEVHQCKKEAYIFMPYCKMGSINDVLYHGRKEPLDEKTAKKFFRDILSGVDYLHSNRITHRDLKLDNFLLTEDWQVVITDYGFSFISPGTSRKRLHSATGDSIACSLEPLYLVSICGTPDYMAPEMNAIAIEQRRYDEEKVPDTEQIKYRYDGKAVDMYSLGVCLFEMINRARPFTNAPLPEMSKAQSSQPVESSKTQEILFKRQITQDFRFRSTIRLSQNCLEVIFLCMAPDPDNRPSARLLLSSNWMTTKSSPTMRKSTTPASQRSKAFSLGPKTSQTRPSNPGTTRSKTPNVKSKATKSKTPKSK